MGDEKVKHLHTPQGLDDLPDEWYWLRLEDACNGVFDCPHSTPTVTESGPLMVRTQDILTGVFRADEAAHVSEEAYQERIQRAEPRYGDLFYSREGTYFGIAADVPLDQKVCLGQRMVLLRPNAKLVQSRFLRYWLNSPIMARHIHGFRDGTVAQRLNLSTIRALPVPIPPLPLQRAIACTLGAFDDKIELNRHMNETLEGIAQSIFRSWFVNFDPVRMKATGRQPHGLPPDIAGLFPDAFEKSELGEIPTGWRVGGFGDVAINHRRNVSPDEADPVTPYIGLGDMPRRSIALDQWEMAEGLGSNKLRFKVGEILFGKLRPYFHKVGIAPVNGICSTDILVISPKSSTWFGFVLGHVSSTKFVAYTSAVSTGTKMPRVNWRDMARYEVVLPPSSLVAAFDEMVRALVARTQANILESRILAELRDTLLPKLISGELRVPDAEKLLKAAL